MAISQRRTGDWIGRVRAVDPHAVDALLALVFTGIALATLVGRTGGDDAFRGDNFFGVGLVLLQTLPIAARRV